jgi:glyoxylase-like metal-dependent hydrolase (beta-lactamase superfamily II)
MGGRVSQLSEHLAVFHGPVSVGLVRDGARALLIDCGDGRVAEALGELGVRSVERLLFTHHHRDQCCGARRFAEQGATVGVPAAERDLFEKVTAYWADPKHRWHIYNFHPHHLTLAEPVRVDAAFGDGHSFAWGPAKIRVLTTPGHTDGSVSYVVEADGQRVLFCGDAICGPGQVWDVHSLQHGFATIRDYHGFLGARPQLKASLGRIKAAKADALVPSHGPIIRQPAKAIDELTGRLDRCYDRYVAISALRHYFPQLFTDYAGRPGHMPLRKGKPVPSCLRHTGTTWVLLSRDRAAFVMDCGSDRVVEELRKLIKKGTIRSVEGLWITHFHDDHVDGVPAFQKAFDCPTIATRRVAEVVREPLAWRLPCISPARCRVDKVPEDGESWRWREFTLTAFDFPGQTLHHGGLLAERGDLRMFFSGDSFTPGGIDDYCAQNRNWLGRGVGFDRCLALMQKLRPTHIFNCHVPDAFDFTPDQLRQMRANLAERETLFGKLVPWEHANFGTDASWVRCQPYEQQARAGRDAPLQVVLTNHAAEARPAACRAVLPQAWGGGNTAWAEATAPPKAETPLALAVPIPAKAAPGRCVIPVDIHFGDRELPQFAEAIIVL